MKNFFLLSLLGLAAAAPLNEKRDVTTEDVVITQYVTTTIWIDPAEPTPAAFFEQSSSSSSASASASSSSSAAAAAPTTSSTPPPAAAPSPAAPATAPAAAPAAAPASGGEMSGAGQLTFYDVTMGTGSCGFAQASPSDYVVAVAIGNLDSGYSGNPNNNPLCGKAITITCNGVTATGKVYDTCPDCATGNLDLSTGFFNLFGSESTGRLNGATWSIA